MLLFHGAQGRGDATLTLDLVQRAKTDGVTVDDITSMKAEGDRGATLEDLIRTRDTA